MSYDDQLKRIEDAQWFMGKAALMEKFRQGCDALMAGVGQAKLEGIPGHAWALRRQAETQVKSELDALNAAVAQESVERFLALMRQEADKETAAALELVETEKRRLLSVLDQEFTAARAFREDQMEQLEQLLIHQDIREIAIIQAKTNFEIELQKLKRQVADSERTTFDAERAVLYKKIEAARVRLRILPEIQATIEAQRKTLLAEQAIVPLYYQKADAEQKLMAVLEQTIPMLYAKSAAAQALAQEIKRLLPMHRLILGYRYSQEQARGEAQTEAYLQRLDDLQHERNRDALQNREHDIQSLRVEKATRIAELEAANAARLASLRRSLANAEVDAVFTVGGERLSTMEHLAESKNRLLPEAARESADIRINEIEQTTETRAEEQREKTEIAAIAEITAKLFHGIV